MSEMEQVCREEFAKFIQENLIKLSLNDVAITTDVYQNNLACMQYVNPEGIVIAQAIYRQGGIRSYQIRKEYRNASN